jgi:serine phosphatase RsbU (regulator of sigma subunit)
MAMAKFSFRALARSHPEPGAFLAAVNEVVVDEIAPGKFLTMVYAVLDPATGALAAANAGHPPLRLVRPGGRVRALPAPGLALGIEGAQSYEEERASVPPGASVVLFTDGVLETRHEGELYGEARLDAFLAANAGLEAQALADALVADVRAFGGGELDDDCAVVCLRLAP